MRVCGLWCPDWPIVAARVRDDALRDMPVAVVEHGARGMVVRATSIEARREGVTRGLRRREAEARCAGLAVIDADDNADAPPRSRWWCARSSSSCRCSCSTDPGACRSRRRGPSRYFGGDDALVRRVLDVVRGVGVEEVRAGIADGELAASLAPRATEPIVVPPGESAAFLAPWSVGLVAPHVEGGVELADLLVRLGLRTLGTFAELPEASVLARFGLPGVHAHRLARGDAAQGATPTPIPPELVETVELDPPAVRVDEAAFAAKMLADRLLGRLDELGLSCSRVLVEAETEHGERMARSWRHDGALTPATLVTRVRWQLEAWLDGRHLPTITPDDVDDVVTSGITLLRLVPDDVIPAVGRQLGFWGSDPAATDRAGRALARVQGMLGVDAVVTAVPAGGRTPTERVMWVPWGEPRADSASTAPRATPMRRGRVRCPDRHRRACSTRRSPPSCSTPTARRSACRGGVRCRRRQRRCGVTSSPVAVAACTRTEDRGHRTWGGGTSGGSDECSGRSWSTSRMGNARSRSPVSWRSPAAVRPSRRSMTEAASVGLSAPTVSPS